MIVTIISNRETNARETLSAMTSLPEVTVMIPYYYVMDILINTHRTRVTNL